VLRHLLELNGGRFLFHEFLKSEYSQENLDFWVKVEEYRNKALGIEIAIETGIAEFGDDAAVVVSARQQLEGVNAMAREIFQNYVANNAPDQININSANRQGITQRIQELGTSSTEHKDSDLFDAAQVEIFRLLSSDSFMRFKKSPYWFRMLKLYEGK
jgi:regulator of G-protein signaling